MAATSMGGPRALPSNLRRKILFAILAILATLGVAEGGLRVAAWLAASSRRGATDRTLRPILAVGDSFTFGVSLDRGESYPAQIEALLEEEGRVGPHRVPVQNEGVPGLSAGGLLERLPELLARYEPRGVVVLAGWNCGDSEFEDHLRTASAGALESAFLAARRSLRSLRVYRTLQYVLSRAFAAESAKDAASDDGAESPRALPPGKRVFLLESYDFRAYQEIGEKNLRGIARLLSERGVPCILATYPEKRPPPNPYTDRELYHWKKQFRLGRDKTLEILTPGRYLHDPGEGIALNAVIREVARAEGVRLADPASAFRGRSENEVFLPGRSEEHPNATGYSIVAREVLRAIREEGWLDR